MAHSKLYVQIMNSREWRETRATYLADHPLCEDCKEKGIYTPAQCVHHLTEIESAMTDRDAYQLACSLGNLRALCYKCHGDTHRKLRSHSKEAHKTRNEQRLARFIERVTAPHPAPLLHRARESHPGQGAE